MTTTITKLFPPEPPLGQWIDAQTLDEVFGQAWTSTKSRFFKLETLQFYKELGVPVYEAWLRGDMSVVCDLARQQADAQAHDPVEARVKSTRIRILDLPVTDYVRFENMVYEELTKVGEIILGVESSRLPENYRDTLKDFLLFDNRLVLVHDYDSAGVLYGSWKVDDPSLVHEYTKLADELVGLATPFQALVKKYF